MIQFNLKMIMALACLASMFGCGDTTETLGEYVKSGHRFFAEENYVQAKLEYKNALQIDDTLVDAYYHLALIDENEKDWRGMFSNLSQTISLDPKHVDARLKLAELHLLAAQLEPATIQIDKIFEIVEDNPTALTLKGILLLNKKDFSGALTVADKALGIDSGFIDAISLKATVFLSEEKFKSALSIVYQALKTHPEEQDLYLLKLEIDSKREDNVAIEADYLNLIQHFPNVIEYNFSLSKHYYDHGEPEKTFKLMQSVVDKHPNNLKAKLLFISFLADTDIDKAENTIKQFIAENDREPELSLRLAQLYIQQNKLDEATVPLRQIISISKENGAVIKAKVLLAQLILQTGDVNEASGLVTEVLELDAGYLDALLLRARIELVNGLYDEAIASLRSILQDYSVSDETMVLLAQAYLKKGAPELAEENFRKALDLNPSNFSAVLPVVSRMIKSKDIIRAESFLLKALEVSPNHTAALQALAQVRLLRKDWLGSQQVANLIETKLKGNGFAKYLGGKISEGQQSYQEAIDKYQLALARNPQMNDALKSMMVCYNALNQKPLMLEYLNEFIEKNPNRPFPVLLKSTIYSSDEKWDEALAILTSGLKKWPNATKLYEAKAYIFQTNNEINKEVNVYKQGLAQIPDSIRLRMLLASAYEIQKDYGKARRQYEILIEKQQNLDIVVNNLVYLLLNHFPNKVNTAKAVELAQRFIYSSHPYYIDTYGWALIQDGKPQQALIIFEELTAASSEIAVFKYHLGLVYSQLNMNNKAAAALEDALLLGKKEDFFVEQALAEKLLIKVNEKRIESE